MKTLKKTNSVKETPTKIKKAKKEITFSDTEEDTEKDTEKKEDGVDDDRLRPYLETLKLDRFQAYESWFHLGSIIYNEGGSLGLFKEFSAKCKNYNAKACNDKWKEYQKNKGKKMMIGSLINMVKEDNPIKLEEIRKTDINSYLMKILMTGITDKLISEVFYLNNLNNIIYDENQKQWYTLNEYNIWEKDSVHEITKRISGSLPKLIDLFYADLVKENKIPDERRKAWSSNWIKASQYVSNVKSVKNIAEKMIEYYKNKTIYEKMDNVNNYLFAFNNGVYDLQSNEFRLPKPEELITCTCGYDYELSSDETKEEILKIVDSMFETKEDRHYILSTIAQCLSGIPSKEKFYFWRGQGRNGKGVMRDFIQQTFGPYFDNMNIEYLNQTKMGESATAADDVLAKKKNCRIVITTEPLSTANLKTNKIKQWSGGDPVQCRESYGKPFNFVPKFKLFIQSNFDINFSGNCGKAMLARLEVKEFPYCFVEDPKLEHEKQLNEDLKETIKTPAFRIAFFHILLEYYNKYIENNKKIEQPVSVKEETNKFFINSDPFSPFYEDIITKVADNTKYEKSSDLFKAFKKYHNSNDIVMNAIEFKAAMISKGHKDSTMKGCIIWRGIQIDDDKLNKLEEQEVLEV